MGRMWTPATAGYPLRYMNPARILTPLWRRPVLADVVLAAAAALGRAVDRRSGSPAMPAGPSAP